MATDQPSDRIFRLDIPCKNVFLRALFSVARPPLERIVGLNRLEDIYSEISQMTDDRGFIEKVLSQLNITWEVPPEHLERIPREHAAIVVANHPFGGIEGLILASVLRSVRPDVKFLANYLLSAIPDMRDLFFFVDPFGGKGAAARNVQPLVEAMRHVKGGGMLGVFPSGEVSHLHLRRREISDPPWSETVARVVRRTHAPVLPVYIRGANSLIFHLLGLIHPRLRTAMLAREMLKKRNSRVSLRVGNLVRFDKLDALGNDADIMSYLRLRTYILGNHGEMPGSRKRWFLLPAALPRIEPPNDDPIVEPVEPELLAAEVARLPADQLMVEQGPLQVYLARASQIPHLLREIGRLREITFREVGEGTGNAIDIDRFDEYYLHLFLWNREKNELVGAYRLGLVDKILRRHGKQGLYTSTLFEFNTKLLQCICPALELGRSFVRAEYQRNYAPLMLLWRGIGAFVVANPQHKILFGPVSINDRYNPASRQLIAAFLRQNNDLPHLAKLVKARNPLRVRRVRGWNHKAPNTGINDIGDIAALVSDIESDEKGIPILLKQYLKLSGNLLGFNIDPSFGDVLDGLILVDLTHTDPSILSRYLGKEGSESFLAYHADRRTLPAGAGAP